MPNYWMQTYSGRVVELADPNPLALDPFDIAASLARICRFTGHVNCRQCRERPPGMFCGYCGEKFIESVDRPGRRCPRCGRSGHATFDCLCSYTVAQHCVLVSEMVPEVDALAGLLHDAAESVVQDLSAPMKWELRKFGGPSGSIANNGYDLVEERIVSAIQRRFGIPVGDWPDSVKKADLELLAAEREDVMAPCARDWTLPYAARRPGGRPIECWPASKAAHAWLERFQALNRGAK